MVAASVVLQGCQAPFPKVSEVNKVHIQLNRSVCFGTCPAYSVDIDEDGAVVYDGAAFVAVTGRHRSQISRADVTMLVDLFRQADFFSLNDKYIASVTDNPFYELTLVIDGRTKTVVDYQGRAVGMPEAVTTLEKEVDRVAGTRKFVKGTPETIEMLRNVGFNFSSPQAATFLADALEIGNQPYANALIEAGAPLNGRTTGRDQPTSEMFNTVIFPLDSDREKTARLFCKASLDRGTRQDRGAALAIAAALDDVDLAHKLIAAGIDPTIEDSRIGPYTALHMASSVKMARVLLGAGIDPNFSAGRIPSPLLSTSSEDIALVLLRASGTLGDETRSALIARAREKGWTRLLARLGA